MKTVTKSIVVAEEIVGNKKLFEDEYAMVSFVESIPCIKVQLFGVPHSSDHYQFVQSKLIESIHLEMDNYCRLHMLTDSSKSGLVLEEDIEYYKMNVVPAMEKAGIRYHAVVLPQSLIVRLILNQTSLSTKKITVEYFNTLSGASKWLKNR